MLQRLERLAILSVFVNTCYNDWIVSPCFRRACWTMPAVALVSTSRFLWKIQVQSCQCCVVVLEFILPPDHSSNSHTSTSWQAPGAVSWCTFPFTVEFRFGRLVILLALGSTILLSSLWGLHGVLLCSTLYVFGRCIVNAEEN